jgi:hypothetical protein
MRVSAVTVAIDRDSCQRFNEFTAFLSKFNCVLVAQGMRSCRLRFPAYTGNGLVSKNEDYRKNAFDTLKLVERARSLGDRLRLLRLAEAWVNLADRAEEIARQFRKTPLSSELHPLIRKRMKNPPDQA